VEMGGTRKWEHVVRLGQGRARPDDSQCFETFSRELTFPRECALATLLSWRTVFELGPLRESNYKRMTQKKSDETCINARRYRAVVASFGNVTGESSHAPGASARGESSQHTEAEHRGTRREEATTRVAPLCPSCLSFRHADSSMEHTGKRSVLRAAVMPHACFVFSQHTTTSFGSRTRSCAKYSTDRSKY
jgi:hypothetical protein